MRGSLSNPHKLTPASVAHTAPVLCHHAYALTVEPDGCVPASSVLRQDAGLIFLSRMTTDVAKNVLLRGGTADEAVATALAATAFATASLGVALVVIGKLKLARFVAYLPMPVVSGRGRCVEGILFWLLWSWRSSGGGGAAVLRGCMRRCCCL